MMKTAARSVCLDLVEALILVVDARQIKGAIKEMIRWGLRAVRVLVVSALACFHDSGILARLHLVAARKALHDRGGSDERRDGATDADRKH